MATPASNVHVATAGVLRFAPPPEGGEPEIDRSLRKSTKLRAGVGCSALSASPNLSAGELPAVIDCRALEN